MGIIVNTFSGKDSSGRNTYSGKSKVNRQKSSSGGNTLQETNSNASDSSTIEARQTQEAIDRINQQRIDAGQPTLVGTKPPMQKPKNTEPTNYRTFGNTETKTEGIASTAGPQGQPGVIMQTTTSGGFSTVVDGGAGSGSMDYVTNQTSKFAKVKSGPPRIQGEIQPANNIPNQYTLPFKAFVGGAKNDLVIKTIPTAIGSDYSAPTGAEKYGAGTASASAYELGKGARLVAEPLAIVYGGSVAFGKYGAGVASARASKVGSLPGVRNLLSGGKLSSAALGVATVGAVSFTGRQIESGFNYVQGRRAGIQDINAQVDIASRKYAEDSSFVRNFGENVYFGGTDKERFVGTLQSQFESTGTKSGAAREAAERIYSNRVSVRGRTDILGGLFAEKAGEGVGRAVTAQSQRYLGGLGRYSTRAVTVGSRTLGSSAGGFVEGGLQSGASQFQSEGRLTTRTVLGGAAFGTAFAGGFGGGLAYGRTAGTKLASRTADVFEGGLNIIDPLEKPGDYARDAFEAGYVARANSLGYPRTRTPTFANFGGSSSNARASVNRGSAPSPSATFSRSFGLTPNQSTVSKSPSVSQTRSFSRSNNFISNLFSTSNKVSSKNSNSVNNYLVNPARTPANIVNRSSANVPARTPASSNNFMSLFTPTNVPAKIPTRVPSKVPTNVPTKVPTNVPTLTDFPMVPFFPGFGGGGGGGGGGGKSSKSRLSKYAPSLTASIFRIKSRRGGRQSSGFTGLEIRGI